MPSAGWAYTYNSRGLGPTAGFLTGWMVIFGYALFVPAGIALTTTFGSQLLADQVLHVTIGPWVLFLVIWAVVTGSPIWASRPHPGLTWPWSPGRWP